MSKIINGITYIGVHEDNIITEYSLYTFKSSVWNMATTDRISFGLHYILTPTQIASIVSISGTLLNNVGNMVYSISNNSMPNIVYNSNEPAELFIEQINSGGTLYVGRKRNGAFHNSFFTNTTATIMIKLKL